jgi:hypothetical protein
MAKEPALRAPSNFLLGPTVPCSVPARTMTGDTAAVDVRTEYPVRCASLPQMDDDLFRLYPITAGTKTGGIGICVMRIVGPAPPAAPHPRTLAVSRPDLGSRFKDARQGSAGWRHESVAPQLRMSLTVDVVIVGN